jgi:hypothetical protein
MRIRDVVDVDNAETLLKSLPKHVQHARLSTFLFRTDCMSNGWHLFVSPLMLCDVMMMMMTLLLLLLSSTLFVHMFFFLSILVHTHTLSHSPTHTYTYTHTLSLFLMPAHACFRSHGVAAK